MHLVASILTALESRRAENRARDGVRVYRPIAGFLETARGLFDCEVRNISRTGVLLRVADPAFAAVVAGGGDGKVAAARLREVLAQGVEVHLGGGAVRMRARVVRVEGRGEDRTVYLGCRFRHRMSPPVCRALGVPNLSEEPAQKEQA